MPSAVLFPGQQRSAARRRLPRCFHCTRPRGRSSAGVRPGTCPSPQAGPRTTPRPSQAPQASRSPNPQPSPRPLALRGWRSSGEAAGTRGPPPRVWIASELPAPSAPCPAPLLPVSTALPRTGQLQRTRLPRTPSPRTPFFCGERRGASHSGRVNCKFQGEGRTHAGSGGLSPPGWGGGGSLISLGPHRPLQEFAENRGDAPWKAGPAGACWAEGREEKVRARRDPGWRRHPLLA